MTDLPAFIVHCPALERDLSHIQAHVPQAIPIETPRTPGSHDGVIFGHQEAVRRAISNKWPAVFVMEDDCQFTEHFALDRWCADLRALAKLRRNVLVGGCLSAASPRRIREGLIAVDRFKSSHCVVYLAAVYQIILKLVWPMDVMIGRLGGKPVVTCPFVALQRPVMSGILGRFTDNTARYRSQEAAFARLPAGFA